MECRYVVYPFSQQIIKYAKDLKFFSISELREGQRDVNTIRKLWRLHVLSPTIPTLTKQTKKFIMFLGINSLAARAQQKAK